jgi:hypothetical protein
VAIAAASSSSPCGRSCLPFHHGGGAGLVVVVVVVVLIYEKIKKLKKLKKLNFKKAGTPCACYGFGCLG